MSKYNAIYLLALLITITLTSCYEPPISNNNDNSAPVTWKGMLQSAPIKPELNWVYYDITLKTSLIFNGTVWDTMVVNGIDGISMNWLGTLDSAPDSPLPNSAYYDKTHKVAFLFNGIQWDTLLCSGQDGLSIQWKGNLTTAPENPRENWIYYDLSQHNTLIFTKGDWQLFMPDGLSGLSLDWLGSFESHPIEPSLNAAYYNTIKRCSYFFDGIGWQVISRDGSKGDAGNSIVWLGEKLYAPVNPIINWAYFSLIDFNSYIFDGTEWQMLAKSGEHGLSIIWVGELDHFPPTPKLNWAFFNRQDGSSYLFDGQEWQILTKAGKDGTNGTSLHWLGAFTIAPTKAEINNLYYNTLSNTTYIYTEKGWEVFAIGGADGFDGWDGTDGKDGKDLEKLCAHKSQYIWSGDTLYLQHNFGKFGTSFIGQYVNPHDSTARSYDDRDSSWFPPFDSIYATDLYATSHPQQERVLFTRNDGTVIQVCDERKELYKGGLLLNLNPLGVEGAPLRFCNSYISHISVHEDSNNTLYISYIDEEQDSSIVLTTIGSDNTISHRTVKSTRTQSVKSILRRDGSLLFIYPCEKGFKFQVVSTDSSISEPLEFATSAIASSYRVKILQNGSIQFFGIGNNLISAIIHPDNTVSEKTHAEIANPRGVFPFVEQSSGMQILPVSLKDTIGLQDKTLLLLKHSPNNGIVSVDTLSMNCTNINLDLLNNDTLSALLCIEIPYRTLCYHMILSPDLEKLSEATLHDQLQAPATTIKNSELYVTHTYKDIGSSVHLLRLRKSLHYPQLSLKILSEDKAGLINHTGRCLLLTLTAYDAPLTYKEALTLSRASQKQKRSATYCEFPKRF